MVNTQTDGLQLVLANLLKATQYNFSIVAENAVGPSQPSVGPCVATTQEDGMILTQTTVYTISTCSLYSTHWQAALSYDSVW